MMAALSVVWLVAHLVLLKVGKMVESLAVLSVELLAAMMVDATAETMAAQKALLMAVLRAETKAENSVV